MGLLREFHRSGGGRSRTLHGFLEVTVASEKKAPSGVAERGWVILRTNSS
jgi:hypothetical protein